MLRRVLGSQSPFRTMLRCVSSARGALLASFNRFKRLLTISSLVVLAFPLDARSYLLDGILGNWSKLTAGEARS